MRNITSHLSARSNASLSLPMCAMDPSFRWDDENVKDPAQPVYERLTGCVEEQL